MTPSRRWEAERAPTMAHMGVPARPQTPRPRPSADAPISVVSGHSEPFEYSCGCPSDEGTAQGRAPREWEGVDDDSVPPVPDVPRQHRRPLSSPPPPLPPKDKYLGVIDPGPSTIPQTLVHGTLPLHPWPAPPAPASVANGQYSGRYMYPRTAPPVPPTRPWSALHGDVGISPAAWSASRRGVVQTKIHASVRQDVHGAVRQGRRRHRPPLPWPLAPRTAAQQYSAEIRHVHDNPLTSPVPVPVPVTPRPPEPSAVYPFPAVAASAVPLRRPRSWSWRQRGGVFPAQAGHDESDGRQAEENAAHPPSLCLEAAKSHIAVLLRASANTLAVVCLSVGFGLLRMRRDAPAQETYAAALALAALVCVHSGIAAYGVFRDDGGTRAAQSPRTALRRTARVLAQPLSHVLALLAPSTALAAFGTCLTLHPRLAPRNIHGAAALAVVASALLLPAAVSAVGYLASLRGAVPASNN